MGIIASGIAVRRGLKQTNKELNVHDRTSAVVMALRERWIALDGFPLLSL